MNRKFLLQNRRVLVVGIRVRWFIFQKNNAMALTMNICTITGDEFATVWRHWMKYISLVIGEINWQTIVVIVTSHGCKVAPNNGTTFHGHGCTSKLKNSPHSIDRPMLIPTTTLRFYINFLMLPKIINNYSMKWKWIVLGIYRDAERRGKESPLFTNIEANNCFTITKQTSNRQVK